jgi:hypothetical protein
MTTRRGGPAAATGEVPYAVTTRTSTAPAASGGAVTVNAPVDVTVGEIPATVPNSTRDTLLKLVPRTVTRVRRRRPPEVGDRLVTVGAPTYAYRPDATTGDVP